MDEVKIKQLKDFNDHQVFIVDGDKVREKLDFDFYGYGHSTRYNFISNTEYWIENFVDPSEYPYFLDHIEFDETLITLRPLNSTQNMLERISTEELSTVT